MFFIKNKNMYMNCILVIEWNLCLYIFLYIKKKCLKKKFEMIILDKLY